MLCYWGSVAQVLACCRPRLLELLVGQVSHLSYGPRKSGFPTFCQQLVSHLLERPGYGYSFALDGAQCSSWFSLLELSKTLVLNVLHLSGACLLTRVSHFFLSGSLQPSILLQPQLTSLSASVAILFLPVGNCLATSCSCCFCSSTCQLLCSDSSLSTKHLAATAHATQLPPPLHCLCHQLLCCLLRLPLLPAEAV